MARFIPPTRLEDIEHPSERAVFSALQSLPDGFVVLHSFPWLRPRRDLSTEPLREGEADFIILQPARGMLVLEVKGGTPELRDRTWYRGALPIRDPFDQARRNKYALLDAIEERTGRRINRAMFTSGEVVVFPHSLYTGPLPLNSDARILIDSHGLDQLGYRIDAAFLAWRRPDAAPPLTATQFSTLLDALMPKMRLLRCAGAEIGSESQRIVQITEDQQATLVGLLESDRVLVEGVAGSGKTLLALEFAVSIAAAGSKALLLCFNRDLASWLQEQARAEPRLAGRRDLLDICTFHAYALALARRAGVEFDVPTEGAQGFWDEEVPMIMEQALDVLAARDAAPVYEAVIVDEAQDFSPDWWVTVESLTRGGRQGRLYALLDKKQSLRGDPRLPSVPLAARFKLKTNCRNTKAIARSGACLAGAEVTLLPGTPEGEPPALLRAHTQAAEAGLVLEEVRRLLRQGVKAPQLALIGPATHANGSLAKFREVEGVPLVDDAAAWRRGAGILVTTARSFKGLEADVVVLYDLAGFGLGFTATDLYVAWTRGRHRLICVSHGAETRASVEAALAAADQPATAG
jgi:hypothetical protein